MSKLGLLRLAPATAMLAVVIALAILSHGNAASEGPQVSLWHSSNAPGGEVEIYLFALKVPSPGLGVWTLDVSYDSSAVTATTCDVDVEDSLSFCDWNSEDDAIHIVGASSSGLEGDFTLARIVFRCFDRNHVVTTDLHLTVVTFADATFANPQPIDAESSDGRVACVPENPGFGATGDVNCDDRVDSLDAVLVLQYTIALTNRVTCLIHADVDGNDYFNAIDAALILQYSAGLIDEFG